MTFKHFAILSLSAIVLTACGGGGDEGGNVNVGASDKYVGTWQEACFTFNDNGTTRSGNSTVVISKVDNNRLTFITTEREFANTTCSGTPTATGNINGTLVITGTKTVNGETVETAEVTLTGSATTREIYKVTANQIQGGLASPVDANGYPTALDPADILTRVTP
jgi:hypothetical protein